MSVSLSMGENLLKTTNEQDVGGQCKRLQSFSLFFSRNLQEIAHIVLKSCHFSEVFDILKSLTHAHYTVRMFAAECSAFRSQGKYRSWWDGGMSGACLCVRLWYLFDHSWTNYINIWFIGFLFRLSLIFTPSFFPTVSAAFWFTI